MDSMSDYEDPTEPKVTVKHNARYLMWIEAYRKSHQAKEIYFHTADCMA